MRACLYGCGLLLTFAFWNARLAEADDNFGAARKMQGANRYSSPGSPLNDSGSSASTAPLFAPQTAQAVGSENAAKGSATNSSDKPSGKSNVQEVFPSAMTRALQASPSSSPPPSPSSSSAARSQAVHRQPNREANPGGGLKSFQQRFSAVRRFAGSNPASDDAPGSSSAQGASTLAPSTIGDTPNGRPVPADRSDLRAAQRFSASPSSAVVRGESASPASIAASAEMDSISAAPVVAEPVTSSRRMPVGQAAGLPTEEDEGEGVTPIAEKSASTSAHADAASPIGPDASGRGSDMLFARKNPILSVETTGPRSITIGKEASYVVTIANAGEAAAQDVEVSIRIPPWTEVVGATASSGSAQAAADSANKPLSWRLARLEAKANEQLTLRLIPRESRPFDLAVQWTFSPVASQAMVEVKEPKLNMTLDGPEEVLYGETKVYKLSLSNPGTGEAENVVLFLSPVDGGPGSPTRHEIGNLGAGESKLVEVELVAHHAGSLAIQAAAVAEGNLRAEVAQEILVRRAALKLSAEGPELKYAGTTATFNMVVANSGNAAAENIQIAAMLPPGAKYVSSNGGKFVAPQHKVVWTVPSLRSGGEENLDVRCLLTSPGANRVQVVATAAGDLSDTVAMTTNVEALADLKLEVSDPSGPIALGEEVTYEVRIRNRGTKAAENVEVAGFFSGGIEPRAAHGAGHELSPGQIVFKPIPSIAAGADVVLKIRAAAEEPGNHVFRAEVNCAEVGTKLAAEETTHFYGKAPRGAASIAKRPDEALTTAPASR